MLPVPQAGVSGEAVDEIERPQNGELGIGRTTPREATDGTGLPPASTLKGWMARRRPAHVRRTRLRNLEPVDRNGTVVESLRETETNVSKVAIDRLIMESSALVFQTMLSEGLSPLTSGYSGKISPCITAIISLSGPGGGTLSLRCSTTTAREVAAKLLTTTPAEIKADGDVCDALGEIANMIAGNLKTQLTACLPNSNLLLSIPTVVLGEDYRVSHLSDGERISLPMCIKDAPMVFEFVFNK